MEVWQCEYTRTVRGDCEQQKARGDRYCYYHQKVTNGLIEADETASLYDMPTISFMD